MSGLFVGAVITVIILEIVLHIVIAAFSHKDADQPRDERDRLFTMKAGNISGWVLGIAVLMIAAHTFIQELDSTWIANLLLFAIEKGKYSPSLEVAFKITETLSVTLDKVFQYQGSEK